MLTKIHVIGLFLRYYRYKPKMEKALYQKIQGF